MPFRVVTVDLRCWPEDSVVDSAISSLGLSAAGLGHMLGGFVHSELERPDRGFQQDLAESIERHLRTCLTTNGLVIASTRYSLRLNEEADFAVARSYGGPRVFFEVEFRPNVEKDLVKFQIGANAETLILGVLILAIDRNNINPRYKTMPEFSKFTRVIDELRPSYPLLMLGFRGTREASA